MNNNKSLISSINKWYQKPLGKALLEYEINGLNSILASAFGYYIVQIGGPIDRNILISSRIHNHIIIGSDIICDLTALPFLPESIDIIVVFHIFEFCKNKKNFLHEIYNALIPGGYLITFNFNQFSLWGIKRLQKASKNVPWGGEWIRANIMKNLLLKTGFNIYNYQTFCFQSAGYINKKSLFLETMGNIFWPQCGATYMLIGQKTFRNLIPIKQAKKNLLSKQIKVAKISPKPASRIIQTDK